MSVELPSIKRRFRVGAGEMILTEISRKYRPEGVESDFARFGFKLERAFTDSGSRFGLLLFRLIDPGARPDRTTRLAAELQRVRRRTLDLIDVLDDERLQRQVFPILSPIAWDLAHIAEFEDLWLVRTVDSLVSGGDPSALAPQYDALQTPRSERGRLSLPSRGELLEGLDRVRKETLRRLRAI